MENDKLYFLTDLQAIVEEYPEGYVCHVDGPDGYQAIDRIEDIPDDPERKKVICKNGITYVRVLYAPVFAAWRDESGL